MDVFKHIGEQIRQLRRAHGLSQYRLGRQAGVSTSMISRWEAATSHPGVDDLERLARLFDVSILALLPERKTPRQESREVRVTFMATVEPYEGKNAVKATNRRRAPHHRIDLDGQKYRGRITLEMNRADFPREIFKIRRLRHPRPPPLPNRGTQPQKKKAPQGK